MNFLDFLAVRLVVNVAGLVRGADVSSSLKPIPLLTRLTVRSMPYHPEFSPLDLSYSTDIFNVSLNRSSELIHPSHHGCLDLPLIHDLIPPVLNPPAFSSSSTDVDGLDWLTTGSTRCSTRSPTVVPGLQFKPFLTTTFFDLSLD